MNALWAVAGAALAGGLVVFGLKVLETLALWLLGWEKEP